MTSPALTTLNQTTASHNVGVGNPATPHKSQFLMKTETIALPEKFVMLVYRFVVGVFLCGASYEEDKSRPREHLEVRISNFAEVMRELPQGSARHVLSLALPTLYQVVKERPIFISFFRTLITSCISFKFSACVVIDFIVNHLGDLTVRQDTQPPLLTLFRIFCMQLNIMPNDEEIFKPYLRRLISECVQRMMTAPYWMYYLEILFGLLNIFQHNTLTELTKELNLVIRQLVLQLNHIITISTDPMVKQRALEISYHIPLSPNQFIQLVTLLIGLCMKGLAGPDPLQRSGK